MPNIYRSTVYAAAFLCASASGLGHATAAETVTAYLRDGSSVVGHVDARTDADYLWLRRAVHGIELAGAYRWSEVLAGRTTEGTLDKAALRRWAADNKQPGRRFADLEPGRPITSHSASPRVSTAPVTFPKTLVVRAFLAQWDKDAQVDGLRIFVSPLDTSGDIVPVDGHIEFTLVLEREQVNGGQRFAKRPDFVEGERGSFLVKREHFATGAAVYELPFSKLHPDFNPNVASQALLTARLSVPGRGVFEASDAEVCLRQPSRFRDQLQYYTPGRYLPLESNGGENR